MAIIDNKIPNPITTIQDLTRKPTPDGMTYTALQAKFDESPELLRQKQNNIIDEVILLDNKNIKDNGNQTINGIKTFISSPIVPTPTTDMQSSTKKYVDDKSGSDTTSTDTKVLNLQNQITSNDGDITTLQGRATTNESNISTLNSVKANANNVYTKAESDAIDLIDDNNLIAHKTSSDHDGRYYTESEINTLLIAKTDLNGNHLGKWQGYDPVQSDPGIQAIVNGHTSQLADIATNIKTFGAKGDGITDDTQSFKNAIAYAITNKTSLLIPNGTFKIDSAITTVPLTGLIIRGQSKTTTIINYNGDTALFIVGDNTHISDLTICVKSSFTDKVIVAGFYNSVFNSAFHSSLINIKLTSTNWSLYTGISIIGRNSGFFDFKMKNIYCEKSGTAIEIITYYNSVVDGIGWLTGITVEDVWLVSFQNYGLKVINDFNDANFPNVYAGQLSQSNFNNITIQSQSRGSGGTGLLLGGGGNTYRNLNIFNDAIDTVGKFVAIEFWNRHYEKYKTGHVEYLSHGDYIFGANTIVGGMVEGVINYNNLQYINTIVGLLHLNKELNTSSGNVQLVDINKKNFIANGKFKNDISYYPLYISKAIYTYVPNAEQPYIEMTEATQGTTIYYEVPYQYWKKYLSGDILTLWLVCDLSDGSEPVNDLIQFNTVTGIGGAVLPTPINKIKLSNNRYLYTCHVKLNVDLSTQGYFACRILNILFNYNLSSGNKIRLYELGFSPHFMGYSPEISLSDLATYKSIVNVSIPINSTSVVYDLTNLLKYHDATNSYRAQNVKITKLTNSFTNYSVNIVANIVTITLQAVSTVIENFSIEYKVD